MSWRSRWQHWRPDGRERAKGKWVQPGAEQLLLLLIQRTSCLDVSVFCVF